MAGGIAAGGQLTTTTIVENFPGFPGGIQGSDLCNKFREQSVEMGTEIITETVTRIEQNKNSLKTFQVFTETQTIECKSVVIATGAVAKKLDIEGVDTYWNAGISACAVCDGAAPIFRKKPIAVVGGGDSAMEEALFLTKYASKVYLIHRSSVFRASKIMQQRVFDNSKIEIIRDTQVIGAYGKDGLLTNIKIRNKNEEEHKLHVNGLFFAIGHVPASGFVKDIIETDNDGYIKTQPGSTKTSVLGIFAAGDVQDKHWRQAITAAGSGCMAALEVEKYLNGIDVKRKKQTSPSCSK